ncbi:hypothetical protein M426DRAFT_6677 [Hypoxylon sp. CI-4A]|nr:hypothetical protein M426DRAFT_6677 [Hypoxylon sp. CI-4A]
MRLALLPSLLQLGLLLPASASTLLWPVATQAEDGALATARHPRPTAAPKHNASTELLKRDYTMGHDTCGFGALDSGITYTCYSSIGTCEDIGNFRGCCTGGSKACSSTFWTQCDDYDATSVCDSSSKTRCCQSAYPYCISWLFSTSGSTVTAFDCDLQSRTRTFELLATPLSLLSSSKSSTVEDSASVSSTPTLTTTSSLFKSTHTATSSLSTSATNGGAVPSSSNSETPTGAIVGGVIGGVAVIALTVLGFLFIRKYRRDTPTLPPPTLSGPQELAGCGTSPPVLATGQSKPEYAVAQTFPILEAADTPATGTGYNRAELA